MPVQKILHPGGNSTLLGLIVGFYGNLDENTVLVSPVNGVVTARNFDNGDMASG